MNKIRTGDEVIVIAGRDKGKRGKVLSRADEQRVVVEGVNIVKKHAKPNPMKGVTGGIIEKTMPIDQSNVAIWNPATSKAARVGFRIEEISIGDRTEKRKVRVFKSNGEQVDA